MGYFKYHAPLAERVMQAISPAISVEGMRNQALEVDEAAYLLHEFDQIDPQQADLAHELTDIQLLQGNKQQIGALWLNRAARSGRVILDINGFLADASQMDTKVRAYRTARENPDSQILRVDHLGHGLSSNHSTAQRKELSKGTLYGVSSSMTDAITSFMEKSMDDVDELYIDAESYGARVGLDIASGLLKRGYPLKGMSAKEIPGTETRRFGIHADFFGYEALRHLLNNRPWLEAYKAKFSTFLADTTVTDDRPDFFRKDPRMAVANFWNSVLGHPTGLHVLSDLVEQGLPIVRTVGADSRVDKPDVAMLQQAHLQEALGKTFGLVVVRDRSHEDLGNLAEYRQVARLSAHILRNITSGPLLASDVDTSIPDIASGRFPAITAKTS